MGCCSTYSPPATATGSKRHSTASRQALAPRGGAWNADRALRACGVARGAAGAARARVGAAPRPGASPLSGCCCRASVRRRLRWHGARGTGGAVGAGRAGLAPPATAAIAAAAGMERPPARVWAALLVGFGGAALSVAPELRGARDGASVGLTIVGMLGCRSRRCCRSAGPTALMPVWRSLPGSSRPLPPSSRSRRSRASCTCSHRRSSRTTAWLAWPLPVGSAALLVWLLRRHDASTISALMLTVPTVTAVLSTVTLGETLQSLSLLGMPDALRRTGKRAGVPHASSAQRSLGSQRDQLVPASTEPVRATAWPVVGEVGIVVPDLSESRRLAVARGPQMSQA